MDHFTRLVHRTGRTVAIIGGGLLVGLMLLTVANIIYRFFGGVIIGSFELIELTIVPIAGFSLVYAGMWHTHTGTDEKFCCAPWHRNLGTDGLEYC
jgi:TRAP-type C4-dicarboxylate transport system permease small subunit